MLPAFQQGLFRQLALGNVSKIADQAVEASLLAGLEPAERETLQALLRQLLIDLGDLAP